MTAIQHFRQLMKERRMFPRGSSEYEWRTRAARRYAWLHKGKPTKEWNQ